MDISYRLNNNQIEKLKKYKNPSIILKKENIFKSFNDYFETKLEVVSTSQEKLLLLQIPPKIKRYKELRLNFRALP